MTDDRPNVTVFTLDEMVDAIARQMGEETPASFRRLIAAIQAENAPAIVEALDAFVAEIARAAMQVFEMLSSIGEVVPAPVAQAFLSREWRAKAEEYRRERDEARALLSRATIPPESPGAAVPSGSSEPRSVPPPRGSSEEPS